MHAETTFDETLRLALTLMPVEKARLLEQLAASLKADLTCEEHVTMPSLYGSLADLGPAPTAKMIDEARREVWSVKQIP